ncbi:MAG: NAD(+)/NADH kinase [Clostridiales Family XIII bacterium]|jgi:NAD+ kinase|nr:NAD(+)/NADH kinase [Clostridiales Family XIII bacterium]
MNWNDSPEARGCANNGGLERNNMAERIVNITENGHGASPEIRERLKNGLEARGFVVPEAFDAQAELIICVGGDGALLNMLAQYDFPQTPIVGVNTGHLGFFQELGVEEIDEFIASYIVGKFTKQTYKTVFADIVTDSERTRVKGLNEIAVRGGFSHAAHLDIYIGDSFVEKFCGDGILIATAAGSTAYNYSLGGAIVDPRLDLIQVTPIAPINSTAYRSFTSGILLPPDLSLNIFPEYPKSDEMRIVADGTEMMFSGIREICAGFNREGVTLLRFKDYDFWNTVKRKLLRDGI